MIGRLSRRAAGVHVVPAAVVVAAGQEREAGWQVRSHPTAAPAAWSEIRANQPGAGDGRRQKRRGSPVAPGRRGSRHRWIAAAARLPSSRTRTRAARAVTVSSVDPSSTSTTSTRSGGACCWMVVDQVSDRAALIAGQDDDRDRRSAGPRALRLGRQGIPLHLRIGPRPGSTTGSSRSAPGHSGGGRTQTLRTLGIAEHGEDSFGQRLVRGAAAPPVVRTVRWVGCRWLRSGGGGGVIEHLEREVAAVRAARQDVCQRQV
jgi:hypothetical protein